MRTCPAPWLGERAFYIKESEAYYANVDDPRFAWQGVVARFILGTKANDRHVIFIVDILKKMVKANSLIGCS